MCSSPPCSLHVLMWPACPRRGLASSSPRRALWVAREGRKARGEEGQTALFSAVTPAVVRALLDRNADPTVMDEVEEGRSALMYQVLHGSADCIATLLQDSRVVAGINGPVWEGATALHIVCFPGLGNRRPARCPTILRLLLAAGADPCMEGKTPLQLLQAQEQVGDEAVAVLKEGMDAQRVAALLRLRRLVVTRRKQGEEVVVAADDGQQHEAEGGGGAPDKKGVVDWGQQLRQHLWDTVAGVENELDGWEIKAEAGNEAEGGGGGGFDKAKVKESVRELRRLLEAWPAPDRGKGGEEEESEAAREKKE